MRVLTTCTFSTGRIRGFGRKHRAFYRLLPVRSWISSSRLSIALQVLGQKLRWIHLPPGVSMAFRHSSENITVVGLTNVPSEILSSVNVVSNLFYIVAPRKLTLARITP